MFRVLLFPLARGRLQGWGLPVLPARPAMAASEVLNVNVGVLGHVDSGKTSLVRALSTVLSTAALDKVSRDGNRQRLLTTPAESPVEGARDHPGPRLLGLHVPRPAPSAGRRLLPAQRYAGRLPRTRLSHPHDHRRGADHRAGGARHQRHRGHPDPDRRVVSRVPESRSQ